MSKTKRPERQIWSNMIRRCEDETANGYHRYGGRGIQICSRWRKSFAAFLEDMGPRPSSEYSIDRIDNDGHYEPNNCRWATRRQQILNKSPHVLTLNAFSLDEDGVALLDEVLERTAMRDVNHAVRYALGSFLRYEQESRDRYQIDRALTALRNMYDVIGSVLDDLDPQEDDEDEETAEKAANDDAA